MKYGDAEFDDLIQGLKAARTQLVDELADALRDNAPIIATFNFNASYSTNKIAAQAMKEPMLNEVLELAREQGTCDVDEFGMFHLTLEEASLGELVETYYDVRSELESMYDADFITGLAPA